MNLKSEYSNKIKSEAQKLGFLSCGISKADFLEDEAPRLEQWLNQGHNGSMTYMERNFDKRLEKADDKETLLKKTHDTDVRNSIWTEYIDSKYYTVIQKPKIDYSGIVKCVNCLRRYKGVKKCKSPARNYSSQSAGPDPR